MVLADCLDTLRYTGMRQNQLLHIRLKDVSLDDGWIELRAEGSKTYREWRVPVVSHLRPRLEALLQRARDCGAGNNDALFHYERFVSSPAERASLSEKPSLQPLRSFFVDCQKSADLMFLPTGSGTPLPRH